MSQQEQWQISGNAPESYERYLVPTLFTPWAMDLVERIALQTGEHVLDVACGTGIVARLAAQHVSPGGTVTGLDLNPGMLAMARTFAQPTDVQIGWREGSAVELPFSNALGNAVDRHVTADAAAGMRAVCGLGDAEELRSLLRQAGFCDVRIKIAILVMRFASVEAFIPGQFAATPFAGAVAALDAAARTALLEDVRVALRSYTDDEGVAVPNEAHIAIARER